LEFKREGSASVHYTDDGNGFPLIFIHGWLMSHRVWTLQAPLSAGARLITLDLRGHGSVGGTGFSYDACCADIATLIDHLQLERVVLVGWSMGAQIAIKVCRALEEKIAGLVLVDGTPHFCSSGDFSFGVPPAEARSMALRLKKNYHRTAGEFFANMFSPQESATLEMRTLAARVVGPLPSLDVALSALNELVSSDLRPDLPLIAVPVTVIHVEDDTICPPGAGRFMAENIPSATLEMIPAAGHAPFLAAPELFNRMITGFVQVVRG
jgi:pimeloyl-[acyl-carrier protein] methyl ester esterase